MPAKRPSAVCLSLSSASACYCAGQLIAGMTNRRDRLPVGPLRRSAEASARIPASTSSCQDDCHDSACSPYTLATFGPPCLGDVLDQFVIQCREHRPRHLNLDLSDHRARLLIDFLSYPLPILRPRAAPSRRCLLDAVELRSRQTQVILRDVVYLFWRNSRPSPCSERWAFGHQPRWWAICLRVWRRQWASLHPGSQYLPYHYSRIPAN